MNEHNLRPLLPMPIKAQPYRHQIEAFNFACILFGLLPRGDNKKEVVQMTISTNAGCAYLMEMG